MGRYVVAPVDEIPPGERLIVDIAGRSIGVFNVKGEFFALRNRCPHQGGPLCTGPVGGFVSSSGPGDYHLARHGEILRCPWHGWEFDI
ncbi:MAG: Rieske 2Fe-2S domain-containing protein, partial [Thermomicrobiales bacterium]|nr:Rieske 2Fe-2S domain-containing protein [Thermomicrobiales bacterium]